MRRPKGNHTSRKFQNSFHVTRRQPKYESKMNCLKYYSGCELSQSDGGPFMLSTSSTVAAKLCQILAKFCTFHQQTNTSSVCTLLIYYKYKTWSRSLQKSDRERFAQVAHDKRVMGAIRSGCSWQKSDGSNLRITLSLTKNVWIAWKTDERTPNPDFTLGTFSRNFLLILWENS